MEWRSAQVLVQADGESDAGSESDSGGESDAGDTAVLADRVMDSVFTAVFLIAYSHCRFI